MDGENNGNPIKMDDLGVPFCFWKHPYTHLPKKIHQNITDQQIQPTTSTFFRPTHGFYPTFRPMPFSATQSFGTLRECPAGLNLRPKLRGNSKHDKVGHGGCAQLYIYIQWLFPGSLNRWDRYHIIPQLAVYTTDIYHL